MDIIKSLSIMFARYGVPDEVISDNGPQFSSSEFAQFAAEWKFNHSTSSPHHPQSNGKAENSVKTIKRLFTKAKEAGISEAQALLDFRNTPSEGIGSSPAQRLMGRRCKTLLVTTPALLAPRFSVKADGKALREKKTRSRTYYDRQARPLNTLKKGSNDSIRLPEQKTWTSGICTGQHGPRSFWVRNRRDIRIWNAPPPTEDLDNLNLDMDIYGHPLPIPKLSPSTSNKVPETSEKSGQSDQAAESPHKAFEFSPPSVAVSVSTTPTLPRYPTRNRRPPQRLIQEC